jgi:hypothetical protein
MQLLSVGLARSIWLFDINELNPGGKSLFPDVLTWLGEKYSFQTFPKTLAEMDSEKKGFLFKAGEFQTASNSVTVNLSIFNDGFVAETWSSTEHGDQFLSDILHAAASRYGLVIPDPIRKTYVSELTVRLSHTPKDLDPRMAAFCKTLDRIFERHGLPPFELSGIGFSVDSSRSSYKPPGLTVERKLGVDFSRNSFWSKSPFATKDHLFALEELEKLLA